MSEEPRGRHAAPDPADRGRRDARHRSVDSPGSDIVDGRAAVDAGALATPEPAGPSARHRLSGSDTGDVAHLSHRAPGVDQSPIGTETFPVTPAVSTTGVHDSPAALSEPAPGGPSAAESDAADATAGSPRQWDPLSDPIDPADLIPLDQPDIPPVDALGFAPLDVPFGGLGEPAFGTAGESPSGAWDVAGRVADHPSSDVRSTPRHRLPAEGVPQPDEDSYLVRTGRAEPAPTPSAYRSSDMSDGGFRTVPSRPDEASSRDGNVIDTTGDVRWDVRRPMWADERPVPRPADSSARPTDDSTAFVWDAATHRTTASPAFPTGLSDLSNRSNPDRSIDGSARGQRTSSVLDPLSVPAPHPPQAAAPPWEFHRPTNGVDVSALAGPSGPTRTSPAIGQPPSRPATVPRERPTSVPDVPGDAAIEAVDLRKSFGDHVAVDGVSLRAERGSIFALLGPNGAGKTTTVNMLCTLLRPDSGQARVAGHDVVRDPSGVRRSIMLTGQFAALDESLTGRENLVLFGRLLGLRKRAATRRAEELLTAFGLSAAAERRVGQYSGGMRRRIDIACGLVTSPQVVFLDEPTTGLDPRSRQEVWRLVEDLRDQGVTTLLTTQYLEEADALSDRIVVIDHGRVIAEGTADDLKSRIGTSAYEVTPADPAQLEEVRGLLAHLMPRASQAGVGTDADAADGIDRVSLTVPAPDGADTLVEIVRLTSSAGVRLSDVSLRRPSLDEVFLTLTGPDAARASREHEGVVR